MGQPKCLVGLDGLTLCQRAVNAVTELCHETFLVGTVAGFEPIGPRVIPDDPPGRGPLGGIVSGIEKSGHNHHLVLAVDYPLVRRELLQALLDHADGFDAACTRSAAFLEPLVAYYHARCAPVIRQMLVKGEIRTHRLFERVPSLVLDDELMQQVDPARWSQFNVNSPDDLKRAEVMLRAGYPT
jgi:molybdenum cofactor guanylyltransferase